jgi:glycosyltransferase involved in cell wall biosynthesis
MHLYSRLGTLAAVRRAAAILTVSEHSKGDIVRRFGLPPERVRVARLAPGPQFRPAERQAVEAFLSRHGLPAGYVLGIGSADPRKNVRALIEAYGRLPAELMARHALVVTFTHPRFRDDATALARQLGIDGRLRCLERVSNADLALLYSAAAAFVYPSLYEGFGLPPLEAMACGAPVVAADNSSLPEVLGDAAALADVGAGSGDPQGSARLALAMAQVLGDDDRRARLRRLGLDRAASFSWRRCAAETAEVYRAALREARRAPRAGEDA